MNTPELELQPERSPSLLSGPVSGSFLQLGQIVRVNALPL